MDHVFAADDPRRLRRPTPGGPTLELLAPAVAFAATLTFAPRAAAIVATAIVALGSLRAFAARRRLGQTPIDDVGGLERQLARWRRREEAATILVIEAKPGYPIRRLAATFRSTDAVAVVSTIRGARLVAALDDHGLDRLALEGRLAALAEGRLRSGWASFPADGTTLEALVENASAALDHSASARGGWEVQPQRQDIAAGAAGELVRA
jgi:hypothetical protein